MNLKTRYSTSTLGVFSVCVALFSIAIWAMTDPSSDGDSYSATQSQKCEYSEKHDASSKSKMGNSVVFSCLQFGEPDHKQNEGRSESSIVNKARGLLHKFVPDAVSLLTYILAISTLLLWVDTRRLAEGAEGQSIDFKTSLDHLKTQADTSLEQIKLAREEFDATHRAKLTIRAMTLREVKLAGCTGIEMVISNIGEGEAIIVTRDIRIRFSRVPPPLEDPDLYFPAAALPIEKIAPGATMVTTHVVTFDLDSFLSEQENAESNPEFVSRLMVWGRIGYKDESEIRRNVSVWRYFDFKTRRFIRTNDPDYEYED